MDVMLGGLKSLTFLHLLARTYVHNSPSIWPSIRKYMYVCVQSVLWLRAPMDKWLDSLSVSQTPRVRIPLNVPFFSFLLPHLTLAIYWPVRTYAQPN